MNISKTAQYLILFGILAALLAACSPSSLLSPQNVAAEPVETSTLDTPQEDTGSPQIVDNEEADQEVDQSPKYKFWGDNVSQVDEQGAVIVEIVPINPNNPGLTLDFKVYLNTHSVDLSMDLTELATLETNTGMVVHAAGWDAPAGGHHVDGKLSFPAQVDGAPLLENVSSMTIRLFDIEVPERVFTWTR